MKIFSTILIIFSVTAYADTICVEEPGDTGITGLNSKSVYEITVSAVSDLGHQVGINKAKCTAILKPKVFQLGTSYTYSAEKWVNNSMTNSTKLKANELEELDKIAKRVVRATLKNVSADRDITVNDVTIEETKAPRRRFVRGGSTLHAGPSFLGNLNTRGVGYYFDYGTGWAMGDFVLGIKWDIAFDIDRDPPTAPSRTAIFTDLNLNLTYYFLESDISPFTSAEFGWGIARDGLLATTSGGLQMGSVLGVAFGRTYGIHVQLGLRGAIIFDTAFESTPLLGVLVLGASI